MEAGEGNSESSNTSYNISVESYSKIQDDIRNNCRFIEKFIDLHSQKYSKSEIFKTLVALHDLFKLEISHGLQLREALVSEKNEVIKTCTELKAFYSFIGSSFNKKVSSLAQVKRLLKHEKQKIDELNAHHTLEIAEYSSKLETAMNTNNRLQMQINNYIEQIENFRNEKKECNDCIQLKLKIQNLESQLNNYKLKIDICEAKNKKISDLEKTINETNEQKVKLEEQNATFLSKLTLITQHVADVQDKYTSTVQKLQLEITKNVSDIKKLKKEISAKDEEYTKTIKRLGTDKSLLVNSIKRITEGKQSIGDQKYRNILSEICRIVGIPCNSGYEDLPSIINRLVGDRSNNLSTNEIDDYYNNIGIRPLILVMMTCNRLLGFTQNSDSDLQNEIDKLKKELIETRIELTNCY